ncbi:MAG TPA: YggS family pyridoxal phosphate-dependent enzyme, partial [Candidatus Methanoperedens sp.]|nr:YggS family pyridoxal phosphate-dependent enzyme [Candidatus Methanoperedens sp.]
YDPGMAGGGREIAERLAEVRGRIAAAAARSGRRHEEVLLVAVSKTAAAPAVAAAIAAGQRVFGENRVQEAAAKAADCGPGAAWHLIGHLQRNKAKAAARLFEVVESLDSRELAAELDRRAQEEGRRLRVLVQVRVGDEPTKSGVLPQAAPALIAAAARLPNLELAGLMAIPPPSAAPEDSRRWFALLRELRERWDGACCARGTLRELSMGMSADYEAAVEEGATIVRVGSVIFGPRS